MSSNLPLSQKAHPNLRLCYFILRFVGVSGYLVGIPEKPNFGTFFSKFWWFFFIAKSKMHVACCTSATIQLQTLKDLGLNSLTYQVFNKWKGSLFLNPKTWANPGPINFFRVGKKPGGTFFQHSPGTYFEAQCIQRLSHKKNSELENQATIPSYGSTKWYLRT